MASKEEISEFIGIMLGDGHIGIYKTKFKDKIKIHRVIKVTLDSRNTQYSEYVSNLLKKVLDTEIHFRYKKNENAVDLSTHRKNKIDYVLNTLKLIISPKWNRMEIPSEYSKGKHSLYVLKGLFDTDGCLSVYKNNNKLYPRIEIRLCPSPAQEQINNILDEYKFNYKVQRLERGKTRIRISGVDQLKRWFLLIGSSNNIHINKAKLFINL